MQFRNAFKKYAKLQLFVRSRWKICAGLLTAFREFQGSFYAEVSLTLESLLSLHHRRLELWSTAVQSWDAESELLIESDHRLRPQSFKLFRILLNPTHDYNIDFGSKVTVSIIFDLLMYLW